VEKCHLATKTGLVDGKAFLIIAFTNSDGDEGIAELTAKDENISSTTWILKYTYSAKSTVRVSDEAMR
jgi:hypothetical protein